MSYIECSLYGIIPHTKLTKLKALLLGLSGNETDYCDHEIMYKPTIETPFGPPRNDDVSLYLKSNALKNTSLIPFEDRHWYLIQKCPPEPPKQGQKLCNHRIVYQTQINGNAIDYIHRLGYTFSFEYIIKGWKFIIDGIHVKIYRVYRIQIQHQLHTAVPLNETDHWLVEIAYPNCHQDQVTMASQRLFALASQLAGLVVLKVLDHTFLQTKLKYSD